MAWVRSVQPECTVPLSAWNFRNLSNCTRCITTITNTTHYFEQKPSVNSYGIYEKPFSLRFIRLSNLAQSVKKKRGKSFSSILFHVSFLNALLTPTVKTRFTDTRFRVDFHCRVIFTCAHTHVHWFYSRKLYGGKI